MYRELYAESASRYLYTAATVIFQSIPPLGMLEASISRLATASIFPPPSSPAVPTVTFPAGEDPLEELTAWYRLWADNDWLCPEPCEVIFDPDHNEFVVEGVTPTSSRIWLARLCQSEGKWELSAFRVYDTSERGSEIAFGRVLNILLGTHPVPTPYEHVTNRVLVGLSGSHAFLERTIPVAVVSFDGEERAFEICGIRVELA